jgi:hypothetical protein
MLARIGVSDGPGPQCSVVAAGTPTIGLLVHDV